MKWYFIVLLIIVYFVIGAAIAGVAARISVDFDDDELAMAIVFLWPIIVPFGILYLICVIVYDLCKGE